MVLTGGEPLVREAQPLTSTQAAKQATTDRVREGRTILKRVYTAIWAEGHPSANMTVLEDGDTAQFHAGSTAAAWGRSPLAERLAVVARCTSCRPLGRVRVHFWQEEPCR